MNVFFIQKATGLFQCVRLDYRVTSVFQKLGASIQKIDLVIGEQNHFVHR